MADAAPSPIFDESEDSDEEAFIRFVETAKTSLYAYAVRLTGSKLLAYDILQDAFIEVFKRWSTLRKEHPDGKGLIPRTYVIQIIRNKYRDYLRSWLRREARNEKWVSQTLPLVVQALPDSECIFNQTARELWAAVGELDPTQQLLIILIYVQEKSITKAAEEIGMPLTTARRRHNEALTQLRSLIGSEE
ncbi:sigma-70 family RNA polymerase sigma factor [Streptomyces sp. NPDC005322]|uniref:RNA polymerase sigma factor n=1 Tax=Streptomyces sp. NPDC005322 TaxID=3157032 RepID=UPI0033A0ED69